MTLTTFKVLEWTTHIAVIVAAVYFSWKGGEKEGSKYMLQYLRERKFLDDTGYNQFMMHVRSEERKENNGEEKDISNQD